MIQIYNRNKQSQLTYYIFLFFILIYYSFRMTYVNELMNLDIFMYMSVPFIFLKFIFTEYSLKEWFIFIISFVVFGISSWNTRDSSLIVTLFVFYGMKNINLDKTLSLYFYMRLILSLVAVTLALLKVIPNEPLYNIRYDEQVTRFSYGFIHPNQLSIVILVLMAVYYYSINKNSKRHIPNVIWLFSIGVQYYLTRSRTSLLLMILFLIFIYIYPYQKKVLGPTFRKISILLLPLLSIFTLLLPYINRNIYIDSIDRALQYRLTISRNYLNAIPIKLVGRSISSTAERIFNTDLHYNSYYILDSGIMQLLYGAGFIGYIIYLLTLIYGTRILIKRGDYVALIIVTIMIALGFIENTLMSILFNFAIFIVADAVMNKVTQEECSFDYSSSLKLRKELS